MKFICFTIFCLALSFFSLGQKLSAEQTAAKKVVVDFYKWYRNNSEKLERFHLYKGKKVKDEPPYVIDWKEVDRYFAFIRKNVPYLGESFIESERQEFKNIQVNLTKYPTDEIVMGFDHDRYTGGQESPEYMVDEWFLHKNTKTEIILKGNKGFISFITYVDNDGKREKQICSVPVAKEKGVWKMAGVVQHEY